MAAPLPALLLLPLLLLLLLLLLALRQRRLRRQNDRQHHLAPARGGSSGAGARLVAVWSSLQTLWGGQQWCQRRHSASPRRRQGSLMPSRKLPPSALKRLLPRRSCSSCAKDWPAATPEDLSCELAGGWPSFHFHSLSSEVCSLRCQRIIRDDLRCCGDDVHILRIPSYQKSQKFMARAVVLLYKI